MDTERFVGGDHEVFRGEDGWMHCAEEYRLESERTLGGQPMWEWRCPHLIDVFRYERTTSANCA